MSCNYIVFQNGAEKHHLKVFVATKVDQVFKILDFGNLIVKVCTSQKQLKLFTRALIFFRHGNMILKIHFYPLHAVLEEF